MGFKGCNWLQAFVVGDGQQRHQTDEQGKRHEVPAVRQQAPDRCIGAMVGTKSWSVICIKFHGLLLQGGYCYGFLVASRENEVSAAQGPYPGFRQTRGSHSSARI